MSVPAWQVSSWNPLSRTAREWSAIVPRLRPMSTSVNVEPGFDAVRYGQVLWGARVEGELVGLAWDWREVRRNVIAMADPMTVLSNLTLVDEHGTTLSESHRLICLNSAIFELRWQAPLRQGPDEPVDERLAA